MVPWWKQRAVREPVLSDVEAEYLIADGPRESQRKWRGREESAEPAGDLLQTGAGDGNVAAEPKWHQVCLSAAI